MSERGSHFLPREDQDAAAILQEQMKKDGVNILFETQPIKVEQEGTTENGFPNIKVTFKKKDGTIDHQFCEVLLLGTGRVPNVETLNCEAAKVKFDTSRGIHVNDHL